ncbi:MAG: hypothetical protein ACYC3O_07690 [Burkholderiales bacterium]
MNDNNKIDVTKIENRHVLTREDAAELGMPNALNLTDKELSAEQDKYDEYQFQEQESNKLIDQAIHEMEKKEESALDFDYDEENEM